MKKTLSVFVITLIITGVMCTAAFAYAGQGQGRGWGQGRAIRQTNDVLCTVDDCEIAQSHQHGASRYCGRDGLCGDYEVCEVDGCTAIGLHEHDGEYYRCQNFTMGKGARNGGCHRK